jgi:hypothetical protein
MPIRKKTCHIHIKLTDPGVNAAGAQAS